MSITLPTILGNYSVLAGAQITNDGETTIRNGNLGSPGGSSVDDITYINGTIDNSSNATTAQAQLSGVVIPAIIELASEPSSPPTVIDDNNYTFYPGGYETDTILSLGSGNTMVFNALNISGAQFYIHASQIVLTGGTMVLVNGAQPENIFWVSDSNITTATAGMVISGNFIAYTAITLSTGTAVNGRLYAHTATITLLANTIVTPIPEPPTPCYLKGTKILTKKGYIPVEQLCITDMVATKGRISRFGYNEVNRDTVYEPIKWVGYFKVNRIDNQSVPICIKRNAFGKQKPQSDLHVSPDHNLIVNGRMTEACKLVNGSTIYPNHEIKDVVYYHVELRRHIMMIAEGIVAESYLDVDNRNKFTHSVRNWGIK